MMFVAGTATCGSSAACCGGDSVCWFVVATHSSHPVYMYICIPVIAIGRLFWPCRYSYYCLLLLALALPVRCRSRPLVCVLPQPCSEQKKQASFLTFCCVVVVVVDACCCCRYCVLVLLLVLLCWQCFFPCLSDVFAAAAVVVCSSFCLFYSVFPSIFLFARRTIPRTSYVQAVCCRNTLFAVFKPVSNWIRRTPFYFPPKRTPVRTSIIASGIYVM